MRIPVLLRMVVGRGSTHKYKQFLIGKPRGYQVKSCCKDLLILLCLHLFFLTIQLEFLPQRHKVDDIAT